MWTRRGNVAEMVGADERKRGGLGAEERIPESRAT